MADKIAEKMREGVEQGVFPGGVLLVSHKGRTVHHAAYGAACLLPKPEPASVDTIYDLASLTKPLATTTAVALLLADGRLSLEDPLERFVPELTQNDLRQATIRHLLNHSESACLANRSVHIWFVGFYLGLTRRCATAALASLPY